MADRWCDVHGRFYATSTCPFGDHPQATLQSSLGDSDYPASLYDGHAPHERAVTSAMAAATIEKPSARMREQVLRAIQDAGSGGMTDDEIEARTGLRHQTASARRRELVLLGRVVANGHTRRTSSGRRAQVWVSA